MDSILKLGGSIKEQRPSRISKTKDGLSTSRILEDQTISKLITLTQDGSNSSHLKQITLLMSKTRSLLMLKEEEMLKDKLFGFGKHTMEQTKDGRFNILMKSHQLQLKESMRNSVFTEIDHSTLSQECFSIELHILTATLLEFKL
jgi:hypothetical protein